MLLRSALFLFIIIIQALCAYLFIRGLKIPDKLVLPVIIVFVFFNLFMPYILWLQEGARQPPFWAAVAIVRPAFAWQFGWITFLLFWAPVIIGARLIVLWTGAEGVLSAVRISTYIIMAIWTMLAIWGLINTVNPPEVRTIEIKMPGLEAAEDTRLIHISDNHVTWWNAEYEFQRIADMVQDLKPDMLVVTGDMVDHHPDYVNVFGKCLSSVKPKYGRFAVIGNHDVYTGRKAVADRMEENGFKMLRDECVDLTGKGLKVQIAGVDDSGKGWTGSDPGDNKVNKILSGCGNGNPVIFLSHRPSVWDEALKEGVDLTLSGHTHGGQWRLPFGGPGLADLTFKQTTGLYEKDGKYMNVSNGTGTVGWPYRLFCPPEITLIILKSK
jgi:uncharacterized protein